MVTSMGDEKWLDLEHVWNTELIVCADGLDWIPRVGERREPKMTPRVLAEQLQNGAVFYGEGEDC